MGVWRTLGYVYGGFTIIGGFVLLAFGATLGETSVETGVYDNTFSQFSKFIGLALVYGGISVITFGIVLIWALVKSGQIESIDKNIKIIAEWAKSQNG